MKRVFYRKMYFDVNDLPLALVPEEEFTNDSVPVKIMRIIDHKKRNREYLRQYYRKNKAAISIYKKKWWRSAQKIRLAVKKPKGG